MHGKKVQDMGETHRLTQEGQKKENSSGSVILVYDYRCIYDVVNKNKIVYSNRNRLTCTTWSVWYPNNKHSKGAGKKGARYRLWDNPYLLSLRRDIEILVMVN